MSALDQELTMTGLYRLAKRRLNSDIADYLFGGAESEATIARNRLALDSREFLPRVLRDVSRLSMRRDFFGREMALPVHLAPIGSLSLFDAKAALASAIAAAQAKIPMFVSIMARPSLEDIVAQSPETALVLQLYMRGDRNWLDETVLRAEKAGCAALCVTVDSAVYGRRERDLLNGFSSAAAVDRVNFADRRDVQITQEQAALSWDTIAWLRQRTRLPLILKGIMTVEDALLCVEHGIDAVYVSNHGGRQLDHTAGALDQLEAIAAEMLGRCRLFVDGGFTRGTDVLKALALGADFVGFGKLQAVALAAGGADGVSRMLAIMGNEIRTSLALLGCPNINDLSAAYLRRASPVTSFAPSHHP